MSVLQRWWQQRDLREQWVLGIGVVATLLLLLFALLWLPLQQQGEQLSKQINAQSQLHQWMQKAAQQVTYLKNRQTMQPKPQGSLLYLLDKSLKNSRLNDIDKRINPKDEQRVLVQFDQVSFDDLLKWLTQLQAKYQIQVESIQIKRLTVGNVQTQLQLLRKK